MTKRHDSVEEWITVREAALIAARTPETIRRWVWSGRLAAHKDGNRLLLSRPEVERVLHGEIGVHDDSTPTLAQWAATMRESLTAGEPGRSAAELVLDDRAAREVAHASR